MTDMVLQTAPEVVTQPKGLTKTAKPWNVIVMDDPVNLMDYVTLVFSKIFGYSKEKSEKHMKEVHELGQSVLWTGDREKAELYVQQLHASQLSATVERAD